MTLGKGWKQAFSTMVWGKLEGLLEQINISQKNKTSLSLFMGLPKTIWLSWTWVWQDTCADLDKSSEWRQGKLLVSNHRCMTCLVELPWGADCVVKPLFDSSALHSDVLFCWQQIEVKKFCCLLSFSSLPLWENGFTFISTDITASGCFPGWGFFSKNTWVKKKKKKNKRKDRLLKMLN